ncbi:MAG: hydroxymethylglutaryl-CoA reductase [Phycisphaeraceae bacterium]
MASDREQVRQHLRDLLAGRSEEELAACLMPAEEAVASRVVSGRKLTPEGVARRWKLLPGRDAARQTLFDAAAEGEMAAYAANIENFIGTARVPVGLAGPLRVRGLSAQGDYYVPLATTEAAMVASYTRGSQVLSAAGGCAAAVVSEGVTRSPAFTFASLAEAGWFVLWAIEQLETFREVAEATTGHGKLRDMRVNIEGNHVYLIFDYTTGDAAGQNMVTIATEAICRQILEHTPVPPRSWFVEANMSGDKKASMQAFQSVRGRKVVAEAVLPARLVERRLHCTPDQMLDYYRVSSLGGVMSGNIGIQGHYANGLAALYVACGQDAACVAESAMGVTRFEAADEGLYVSVTLPNLIVGTVGGGTALPTQKACLDILGMAGSGFGRAFAELCAAVVLAGEISIIGALAAGHFTRAHERLARGRQHEQPDADDGDAPVRPA